MIDHLKEVSKIAQKNRKLWKKTIVNEVDPIETQGQLRYNPIVKTSIDAEFLGGVVNIQKFRYWLGKVWGQLNFREVHLGLKHPITETTTVHSNSMVNI